MRIFRLLVGGLVQLINWLTLPKKGQRTPEYQRQVEQALHSHALYQFAGCPFCIKVRRAARRLNLPLELRDASSGSDGGHRQDLLEQGGRIKTPCLRIDKADGSSQWMYESKDIITYLTRQFPLENDGAADELSTGIRADV
ncbi:MAG: glutaredoxin [Motiliproteus sp.]|jgi:glutaredoxin